MLFCITWIFADKDFIEWHQGKAWCAVDNETVLQGEFETLGNDAVRTQCLRIVDSTAYVDFHYRSPVGESACLKNEVLDGLIVGILVCARIVYFATDGDGAFYHLVLTGRDEEHIILLQWYVGHLTTHDACNIDADYLQRAVGFHAMHYGTGCKCFLGESLCMFYESANAVDLFAQVVHAGTEYGSLDFYGIGITWQDRVYANRVAISYTEVGVIEFFYVEYRILSACLTIHANGLGIGISCKTTGILEYGVKALVLLHLVEHRALYLSADVDQAVVWAHHDDIIIGQANVACQFAVENIVVDIYYGYKSVVTINLDVAQGSEVVGASCHIQGMEHGGKG